MMRYTFATLPGIDGLPLAVVARPASFRSRLARDDDAQLALRAPSRVETSGEWTRGSIEPGSMACDVPTPRSVRP